MTAWHRRVAAALLAGSLVWLPAGSVRADGADGDFSFTDPDITESSGLVALPTYVVTVNDSGNPPVLFLVSRRTGRTVDAVRFTSDETVDPEALSPGATAGEIWVGDIGDNRAARTSVTIYRTVVPRPGVEQPPPAKFRLRYSDGPHDAEALMIDGEGRVVIASKGPFSGKLYRSEGPPSATGTTVLRPIARVPGLVTDGVLSKDGTVLYLRTYGVVVAYTYPDLGLLGTFPLPPQPQGEGLARDGADHLLVSSEGVGEAVKRVAIPPAYRAGSAITEAPSPSSSPSTPTNGEPPPPGEGSGGSWWHWWPVAVSGAAIAVVLYFLRVVPPRSRRTR